MLHFIAGFCAAAPVWIAIGAYGWFRFGSHLKADLQKVETAVTSFKGKVSGK